ncbi:MAG TPA: hypothetical protein PKC43_08805 [Phycisphaerales bacterium]|nr:hypothetical protein [Phycisphaerales bacterium]HMP37535.1 hypothetical protein [Phycisphaerales bacterium]
MHSMKDDPRDAAPHGQDASGDAGSADAIAGGLAPESGSARSRPEPLPIEPSGEDRDAGEPARGSEPCPNCGVALAGPKAVVCTACGYDLAAVRQRQTVVGRPVAVGAAAESRGGASGAAGASSSPTRSDGTGTERSALADASGENGGGPHAAASPGEPLATGTPGVPLILAGVALAILIVCYLAGASGLFERRDGLFRAADGEYTASEPSWSLRFVELGRFVVRFGILWIAAALGIALVGHVRRRPIGALSAFAARVAAVVSAAALVSLIALERHFVERTLEAALAAAAFVGLSMLWFRLAAIDALQASVATIVLVGALWLAAVAVVSVGVW